MEILFALLASASAFPAKLLEGGPKRPPPELFSHDMQPDDKQKRPYHYYKNVTSTWVRYDAEWWGKALTFAVALSFVLGLIIGSF